MAFAAIRRDFMKCRQCRHDKQRCEPSDRDWSKQEKCKRCQIMAYDCGPAEKAQRKPRKTTPATQSASTMPLAAFRVNLDHISSGRPLVEGECKRILEILASQIAARNMLLWDFRVCEKAEQWTGDSFEAKTAIDGAIHAVEAKFGEAWAVAESIDMKNLTATQEELWLSHFESMRGRFYHSTPFEQLQGNCVGYKGLSTRIRDRLRRLLRAKNVVLAADQLCEDFWDPDIRNQGQLPTAAFNYDEPQMLKDTCQGIASVLSEITLDVDKHEKLLSTIGLLLNPVTSTVDPYSPCHILARRATPIQDHLYQGWSMSLDAVDCLRKTPIHDAAYVGKVFELCNSFKYSKDFDPSIARCMKKDVFGLTPLQIVVCTDDVRSFNLLRKYSTEPDYGHPDAQGRSFFNLAVRNRSENIIQLVLKHDQHRILFSGQVDLIGTLKGAKNNTTNIDRQNQQSSIKSRRSLFTTGKDVKLEEINKSWTMPAVIDPSLLNRRKALKQVGKRTFVAYEQDSPFLDAITSIGCAMTLTAAHSLVYRCRYQWLQFLQRIYPWPRSGLYGQPATTASQSLGEDLRPLAARTSRYIEAMNIIEGRLLQCKKDILLSACDPALRTSPEVRELSSSKDLCSHQQAIQYSTANILETIRPSNVSNISDLLVSGTCGEVEYRKTASEIRKLFQCGILGIPKAETPQQGSRWPDASSELPACFRNAFPASHIAYWNSDQKIALELWKQDPEDIDILGRTFAHVVAEAGDASMLEELLRFDASATKKAGNDVRGLSLIDITASLGPFFSFSSLLDADAGRIFRPQEQDINVLDLALASGNTPAIHRIVNSYLGSPPYTKAVRKAIELSRADLAEAFLPWLDIELWNSREELWALAEQAQNMAINAADPVARDKFSLLAESLRTIQFKHYTANDALFSLQELHCFASPQLAGGWTTSAWQHYPSSSQLPSDATYWTRANSRAPSEAGEGHVPMSQSDMNSALNGFPDLLGRHCYPWKNPFEAPSPVSYNCTA